MPKKLLCIMSFSKAGHFNPVNNKHPFQNGVPKKGETYIPDDETDLAYIFNQFNVLPEYINAWSKEGFIEIDEIENSIQESLAAPAPIRKFTVASFEELELVNEYGKVYCKQKIIVNLKSNFNP